jgi:hypothetical protein
LAGTTHFFLITSGAVSAWLFVLWAGACAFLKLVSLYFPSINAWRGSLTRLLAWGWMIPFFLAALLAYIALLRG